jgi:hypothetical protein
MSSEWPTLALVVTPDPETVVPTVRDHYSATLHSVRRDVYFAGTVVYYVQFYVLVYSDLYFFFLEFFCLKTTSLPSCLYTT